MDWLGTKGAGAGWEEFLQWLLWTSPIGTENTDWALAELGPQMTEGGREGRHGGEVVGGEEMEKGGKERELTGWG